MSATAPTDPLAYARQIARKHFLRIVIVPERRDPAIPGDYVNVYTLYGPTGLIGRRRDPSDLLRLVKTIAGIP